jgi:hypothetical protein
MATDSIGAEALDKLLVTLQSLLPPIVDPVLPASVQVVPVRISVIGVGGVIGISQNPAGEIQGRRVEATVLVTAAAKDTNSLGTAVTAIARAFTADPSGLRESGIERLVLAALGPAPAPAGGAATVQRELTFDVTYEYLKFPTADEGQIKEVPIDLQVK